MPLVVISRHLSHACRVPAELFDILATHGGQLGKTVRDEQRESYTSPISPLYLPYISPISPWPGARRAARELQHALAARVRPEWRGESAQANPNPKPSPSPHPSPSPSQASPSPHPSPSPSQASRRKLPDRCDQAWFVRSFCSGEGGCAPEAG